MTAVSGTECLPERDPAAGRPRLLQEKGLVMRGVRQEKAGGCLDAASRKGVACGVGAVILPETEPFAGPDRRGRASENAGGVPAFSCQ